MKLHGVQTLDERHTLLDKKSLAKIELGEYEFNIPDYLQFNEHDNTRRGSVNPHLRTGAYKNFFSSDENITGVETLQTNFSQVHHIITYICSV